MQENSPQAFIWLGNIYNVFLGEHAFRFQPAADGKATLFVHEEKCSGMLGWLNGENWIAGLLGLRETTRTGFEGFNRDLKTWVEGK